MTAEGAAQKTGLLMAVAFVAASYTWAQIFSGSAASAMAALATSKAAGMVGLGAALATMFKPHWAPVSGLIYAVAKGLAVGGMAAMMELRYPGIAINAVMLTFGTAVTLGAAFQARIINVNDTFRSGVMMVTGGFMLTLLASFALSLVGVQLPGIFSGGPLGIGIGLVSAGLAASNLLIDFDSIRQMSRQRMPKWFESYAAFSLMVTLVWMFTSVLRLLGMLGGERD